MGLRQGLGRGIGVFAAVVVLATAGCAGGGGNAGTATGQSGAGAAVGERNNGALRAAWPAAAVQLDPHTPASDVAQFPYASLVYDRLTMTTIDGSLGPMLATEWSAGDDGLSYTFTLRDGVTFSDGEKVDAAAVKASLDRALTKPESTAKNRLTMIAAVEVVSPNQVKITTKRPARDLPYVLSGMSGAIISPKALDNPDLDQKPVGSGPYTLTELKLGQSATYTRRDDYWDADAAKPRTIVLSGIADANTRLNSLRSGQIDLAMGTSGSMWGRANELPKDKFAVSTYPATGLYDLWLNTARPALQDVKVRQALNYAIDREAINKSLIEGQCAPQAQPFNSSYGSAYGPPPIVYTYDPAKAKQLLAEAGHPNGVKLQLIVGAGLSPQGRIATATQAQAKEAGFDIEILEQDPVGSVGNFARGGGDLLMGSRWGAPTPGMTLDTTYLNATTFPGPVPDSIRANIVKSLDPRLSDEEANAAAKAAADEITTEALAVTVCAYGQWYVQTTDVTGADQQGTPHYQAGPDLRYVGIKKS